MKPPGGPKKQAVKLPKRRTEREQREITRMKLEQYVRIGWEIMGKKSGVS